MNELLQRAKNAGVIRPDIGVNDITTIFAMLGVAYELKGPSSPESYRRYLALILDGIRATDREPLPVPELPDDELDAALASARPRFR